MDEGQEEDEGRVETEIVISSCSEKMCYKPDGRTTTTTDNTAIIVMMVGDFFLLLLKVL